MPFGNYQAVGAAPATSSPIEIFLAGTDYSANEGSIRVRPISGTGGHRFTFKIPDDLTTLTSAQLIGIPSAGAAGAGKDIDLHSDYGAIGEASNFHTESDIASTYDLTGKAGQWTAVIDLTAVLTAVSAGDYVGVFVDHNAIGGPIDYVGVELVYS